MSGAGAFLVRGFDPLTYARPPFTRYDLSRNIFCAGEKLTFLNTIQCMNFLFDTRANERIIISVREEVRQSLPKEVSKKITKPLDTRANERIIRV